MNSAIWPGCMGASYSGNASFNISVDTAPSASDLNVQFFSGNSTCRQSVSVESAPYSNWPLKDREFRAASHPAHRPRSENGPDRWNAEELIEKGKSRKHIDLVVSLDQIGVQFHEGCAFQEPSIMHHSIQSRISSNPLVKCIPIGLLRIKSQYMAATFLLQLLKCLKVARERQDSCLL